MSENTDHQLPVWAHRLKKSQIERLYRSCGEGRLDEQLIDDVGFSLYARCMSMLQVSEAIRGRPPCPSCGTAAQLDKVREVRRLWMDLSLGAVQEDISAQGALCRRYGVLRPGLRL